MLIKVCCIQNERELVAAASAGVTHVGLVGAMPSGPGPIEDEQIARVAEAAPPGLTTVLLTSRTEAGQIVDHVTGAGTGAVQIVQPVPPGVRHQVRLALPALEILQVVHVEGPESIDGALEAADGADYVLLDSGRPGAATPELGGTGRVHDWSVSASIVDRVDVPVILAGGLRPTNVREAIDIVRPSGVDVCTGLRDHEGRLVTSALQQFIGALREA